MTQDILGTLTPTSNLTDLLTATASTLALATRTLETLAATLDATAMKAAAERERVLAQIAALPVFPDGFTSSPLAVSLGLDQVESGFVAARATLASHTQALDILTGIAGLQAVAVRHIAFEASKPALAVYPPTARVSEDAVSPVDEDAPIIRVVGTPAAPSPEVKGAEQPIATAANSGTEPTPTAPLMPAVSVAPTPAEIGTPTAPALPSPSHPFVGFMDRKIAEALAEEAAEKASQDNIDAAPPVAPEVPAEPKPAGRGRARGRGRKS